MDLNPIFDYLKATFGEDWEKCILWIKGEDEDWVYCYLPTSITELWYQQKYYLKDDFVFGAIFSDFVQEINAADILSIEDKYWVNPRYEDLMQKANKDNKIEVANEILMRSCRLKDAAAPSSVEFRLKLTTLEKEALDAIYKKIGNEGNISVVKMIQETTISRPIWTALLGKMKEFNFAEVENQGVKGTHIKFN